METIFPTGTGLQGFFSVGFRKHPLAPQQTQRVGVAMLKRTYAITPHVDPAVGTLAPFDTALPIFVDDLPFNLLRNGDFEATQQAFGEVDTDSTPPRPGGWTAGTGATATLAPNQGRTGAGDTALQVQGSADSRVVQTIATDAALGGRTFTFSVWAKADAATNIAQVQIEADGSGPICVMNRALTTTMTRHSATGVWPANVQTTTMRVVLRMATAAARTVYYDDVQVEEQTHLTALPIAALRYEHDVAPYKPEGDLIVLGFTGQAGIHRLQVNGTAWLQRNVVLNGNGRDKALFGWEPRGESARKGEAGTFAADPAAYPPAWPVPADNPSKDPLPANFSNRFFNGYRRDARLLPALPHLLTNAAIAIERNGTIDYAFHLFGETVAAIYTTYDDIGLDEETCWHPHAVIMNLDTLVIEPDQNRGYTVWRGVWNFDAHPEDAYRRLTVSVS